MLWQINSQVGHQNFFEPTDRHQIGYSGCYFETISTKNCSSQENILMKFSHATPLRQFKTKNYRKNWQLGVVILDVIFCLAFTKPVEKSMNYT